MQDAAWTIYGLSTMMPSMETAIPTEKDYYVTAGARLKLVIGLLGSRQVEAAAIMGISRGVLHHWVEGNHPPKPYAIYRLRQAKRLNFDYVFMGDRSGLPHALGKELDAEPSSGYDASV